MKLFKKPKQNIPLLPEHIHIYREDDGNEHFFVASDKLWDMGNAAEEKNERLVGVYKLQHMIKVRLQVASIPVDKDTYKMSWDELIKQLQHQGEKFKKAMYDIGLPPLRRPQTLPKQLGKGNHHK